MSGRFFAFLLSVTLFAFSSHALLHHRLSVNPSTYWDLGLIAQKNGSLPRALYYFNKASSAGANLPEFYLEYAATLYQAGEYGPALEKALLCSEESSNKELLLGKIYYALDRYPEAEEVLEKAVRTSRDNPLILAWLGETYVKLGKRWEAVFLFEEILARPDLPKALKGRIANKIRSLKSQP